VISRALHQVSDPARALAYVRRWLRPDGRLICLDFAFDRRPPRWLATTRSLLERQTSLPVIIWEIWRPLPLLSASTRSGSASTWSMACAPPILENEVCS
jgi:SAM-dependent methyltransferase